MTNKVTINRHSARVSVRKPHTVNHNGKCNEVKSLVFILLYDNRYFYHKRTGMTVDDLVKRTGASETYLQNQIKKWCGWGFLLKTVNNKPGRCLFRYRIAARGRKFVDERIPVELLKEYRQKLINIKKGY